jgi:hypothetical protein
LGDIFAWPNNALHTLRPSNDIAASVGPFAM